jgi:GAF domain-containing protein
MPELDVLGGVPEDAWPVLEQLARALRLKEAELKPTLEAIAVNAVETVEPAAHSGVILMQRGALLPQASVGEPTRLLDEWQQEHRVGPCIDAAQQQQIVDIVDTAGEHRWSGFGDRAYEVGVRSMLCVPLWVEDQSFGTLSLYAASADAFTEQHVRLTRLFATHAALALSDANRAQNLRAALVNRDVIGQAKGILIERNRITAEAAFEVLAAASQATNVKLVAVAQHLVDTGEVPAARVRR